MSEDSIAVYGGYGSSHSWTWLADLFEGSGIHAVRFLDSGEFIKILESRPSLVIISGGDGFAIARSLSGAGFTNLEEYIRGGGTYVGICAGAYLPLPSSVEPFSQFNISTTKIENLDCGKIHLENMPSRVAVKYGHCSIVHPVRGEVELGTGSNTVLAPLYGGPIFKEPERDEVLLRYRSFTRHTEYQFAQLLAYEIVIGNPAAVLARHGKGKLFLLGPHLEHPSYHAANRVFLNMLGLKALQPERAQAPAADELISSAIADLKVAILGLENRSFVVGKKLWDGARYLELVRAIEKRVAGLGPGLRKTVSSNLRSVRDSLAAMTMGAETEVDEPTGLLVQTARMCVDNHFLTLSGRR